MELAKLGFRVDKNTVAKYMAKSGGRPRRPSQTWTTFVRNHLAGTLAIDFFTVPTVTFDIPYVFVILSLERRLIVHVNVTAHPYAQWAAQQIVEAFGHDGVFKILIRDRDKIFGAAFDRRVNNLGGQTAPHRAALALDERLRREARRHLPPRVDRSFGNVPSGPAAIFFLPRTRQPWAIRLSPTLHGGLGLSHRARLHELPTFHGLR
jgi:hypothetical protein